MTYAGKVSWEAGGGCHEEKAGGGTGEARESAGPTGEADKNLKALLKRVSTSVGRLSGFSLFQCTKDKEDSFKTSGLAVTNVALDNKKLDEHYLIVKCSLLDQKTVI